MPVIRKLRAAAIVVALTSAGFAVAAVPASAAGDGEWVCGSVPSGNGSLCVRFINGFTGADEMYIKTGGGTVTLRFELQDGSGGDFWDNGSFSESAGQTRSFAWNGIYGGGISNAPCLFPILHDLTDGTTIYGPADCPS